MAKSKIMPSIEEMKHLQIPLKDISLATNGFSDQNLIAKGGFGKVYKGVSEKLGEIAVKQLDRGHGQGEYEFKTEIALLPKYKHKNIVSLLGFCDENDEKILVYKHETNGSLDTHLNSKELTWIHLLQICLDVARGLKHVHDNDGSKHRIFHRDVKSSNILLDANWRAKISDFGLSRVCPADMQSSFVISNVCGTPGYIDPDYYINGYLTEKSDVYSFGVVLWEVLCGRHTLVRSYKDESRCLTVLAQKHYTKGTLNSIIPSYLQTQIKPASLLAFSDIAYQCLKNGEERPTMKLVVEQLQEALDHQLNPNTSLSIEEMKHLQIPLQDIVLATNGFTEQNLIDDSGKIYRGKSKKHGHIVIHRLGFPIELREFELEIALLSERKHDSIFSLLGYCSEGGEKILVYKDESKGTLDEYLDNEDLTWVQRLRICQDVGRGLIYLNDDVDRIIHRDFKSSNIFLDVDQKPKVLNFPTKSRFASVITNPFGTPYFTKGDLTQKSSVYSLGVMLWEVLCGRRLMSDKDDPQSLLKLVREHYKNQTLNRIIPSYLLEQMDQDSLITFSSIAYQCLNSEEERPSLREINEQLQKALDQQLLGGCSSHQGVSTELDLKLTPTSSLLA